MARLEVVLASAIRPEGKLERIWIRISNGMVRVALPFSRNPAQLIQQENFRETYTPVFCLRLEGLGP